MLKISVVKSSKDSVTLLLEGRIGGEAVEQLRSSCEQVLVRGQQLTLDFGGVSFLEREGVTLCHSLADRQVKLINRSVFVAEQLKARETK
jgi:hypothetical protein